DVAKNISNTWLTSSSVRGTLLTLLYPRGLRCRQPIACPRRTWRVCGVARPRLSSPFAPRIMLDAMLRPMPERDPAPPIGDLLPTVGGKFFFVGAQKMYMRSVSYGPF